MSILAPGLGAVINRNVKQGNCRASEHVKRAASALIGKVLV